MAADYRDLLPMSEQPIARYALTLPTSDRLRAQSLADELGASRRHGEVLQAKVSAQQSELGKRAEWAIGLDAQLGRARATLDDLNNQIEERTVWAQSLDAEIERLRTEIARLQPLAAERDQLLASTSWRVTKPLRYAMRKLRVACTARFRPQPAARRNSSHPWKPGQPRLVRHAAACGRGIPAQSCLAATLGRASLHRAMFLRRLR